MEKTTHDGFNQDFMLDPKKDKKLFAFAEKVFKNPELLATADIMELSPNNPALASKILLASYTRALIEETRKHPEKNNSELLENLKSQYAHVVDEFLSKNKELASSQIQKGGI